MLLEPTERLGLSSSAENHTLTALGMCLSSGPTYDFILSNNHSQMNRYFFFKIERIIGERRKCIAAIRGRPGTREQRLHCYEKSVDGNVNIFSDPERLFRQRWANASRFPTGSLLNDPK